VEAAGLVLMAAGVAAVASVATDRAGERRRAIAAAPRQTGDMANSGQRRRRIAVVPAFNEAPTVAAVLDRLYPMVDELVVVDDGSRDGTRAAIEAWLPAHRAARLLAFDENRGMSAAYYAAFTHLRGRLHDRTLASDDLVF